MSAETTSAGGPGPQKPTAVSPSLSQWLKRHGAGGYGLHVGIALTLVALWQIAVDLNDLAPLVLPGPFRIVAELAKALTARMIWINAGATLIEILGGFVCGSVVQPMQYAVYRTADIL